MTTTAPEAIASSSGIHRAAKTVRPTFIRNCRSHDVLPEVEAAGSQTDELEQDHSANSCSRTLGQGDTLT